MGLVASSTNLERTRIISDETASTLASEEGVLEASELMHEKVAKSTATTTSATGWSLHVRRFLDRYAAALEEKPLLIKTMSSAFVGVLGDLISQYIFWSQGGNVVWHDKEAMRHTLAVALDGVFFNAPVLHYMYGALDKWIPADEKTSYATIQVAIDVLVIDPVYAFIFIFTTGFFEGKSIERDMIPTIKEDYLSLASSLILIGLVLAPAHVYLFKHLSLKWRVLISDARDVVWVIVATYVLGPAN